MENEQLYSFAIFILFTTFLYKILTSFYISHGLLAHSIRSAIGNTHNSIFRMPSTLFIPSVGKWS